MNDDEPPVHDEVETYPGATNTERGKGKQIQSTLVLRTPRYNGHPVITDTPLLWIEAIPSLNYKEMCEKISADTIGRHIGQHVNRYSVECRPSVKGHVGRVSADMSTECPSISRPVYRPTSLSFISVLNKL